MAKPTGGLLAFSARGSIAKTIVFSAWRGRQYVRQHVIPANPRSFGQTTTRRAFTFVSALFKLFPGPLLSNWTLAAKGLPVTDRNLFGKANISALLGATDLTNLTLANGAKGGLALESAVATSPAPGVIHIDYVAPSGVPNWQFLFAYGNVLADQPAVLPLDGTFLSQQSAMGTDTLIFSGLATGTYYWSVFPSWNKPTGDPGNGPDFHGLLAVA